MKLIKGENQYALVLSKDELIEVSESLGCVTFTELNKSLKKKGVMRDSEEEAITMEDWDELDEFVISNFAKEKASTVLPFKKVPRHVRARSTYKK